MSTNHTPESLAHGEAPVEVTPHNAADARAATPQSGTTAVAETPPKAKVAATEPSVKAAKVKPPKAAPKPSKTSVAPKPPAAESVKPRAKASKKAPTPAAEVKPAAAPKRAKVAPAARKPEKPVKTKLVRDSFTMPQADFDLVDVLKQRALNFRHAAKKGELLRAGLQALAALSETDLQAALERVTSLKPGRPKKAG